MIRSHVKYQDLYAKNNGYANFIQSALCMMTIGPVVSEIISLTKIDMDGGQTDGRPIFSYSWGHKRPRKYESSQVLDGLDYNTSLAYTREVKVLFFGQIMNGTLLSHYRFFDFLHTFLVFSVIVNNHENIYLFRFLQVFLNLCYPVNLH